MTTHYLGIDPGHSGAIACISAGGQSASVHLMPTRTRKETKEVDVTALRDILAPYKTLPHVKVAIEWPNAWPGTFGNVGRDAMIFGRGMGTLDTALQLMGFDYERVTPQAWKGRLGLCGKAGDAKSVQGHLLWQREYPQHAALVLGGRGGLLDGPLDAFLIAHWLRRGGESPCGHKGGPRPPKFKNIPTEYLPSVE